MIHAITAGMEATGFWELPTEDQPPSHIWHSNDRLKEWFDGVKQRREDQMKGVDSNHDEPVDDLEENEAANDIREELNR